MERNLGRMITKRTLGEIPETPVSHDPDLKKRVLLRYGEVLPITQLAEVTFKPGQAAREHVHPTMKELFLVQKGVGRIRIGQESQGLGVGDFLVVPEGTPHELSNTGEGDLVLLYLGIESTPQ